MADDDLRNLWRGYQKKDPESTHRYIAALERLAGIAMGPEDDFDALVDEVDVHQAEFYKQLRALDEDPKLRAYMRKQKLQMPFSFNCNGDYSELAYNSGGIALMSSDFQGLGISYSKRYDNEGWLTFGVNHNRFFHTLFPTATIFQMRKEITDFIRNSQPYKHSQGSSEKEGPKEKKPPIDDAGTVLII